MNAKSPKPGRFLCGPSQQTDWSAYLAIPGLVASKLPPRKRKRLTRACDTCRKRKIRCDGRHPCGPCVAYESACSYEEGTKKRGPRGGPHISTSVSLPPDSTDTALPDKQRRISFGSGEGPASAVLSNSGTEGTIEREHYGGGGQLRASWSTRADLEFARQHPHVDPRAHDPTIRSPPWFFGGRPGSDSAVDWHTRQSAVDKGNDLPPPPFPLLPTMRAALQTFSKLGVSALAPDSLRKWCASQPFDALAWRSASAPDHVDLHLQRSMSFALGLAIAVFVYRICGLEALSSLGTFLSQGISTNSQITPGLAIDDARVADWMSTSVDIAMFAPCAMDSELGVGDCHLARGLTLYLLAYSELTAGNVSSARRMCLAALDVLQEEDIGVSSSLSSLTTVFLNSEVLLSVSTMYHTLSLATHMPGGRSSELINEYECIMSDPAVAEAATAGGLGSGVISEVHLDLFALTARAVDMSSAPSDRMHPEDRLSLLHSLQAVMVALEAADPFPPEDPTRFAPALFVRIHAYALMIQLARPAILETLGMAADGKRLSPHACASASPPAPALHAILTYATAALVRMARWISGQSIDVNPFLQHSFAALAHAIAPVILQATSGVAMMIAGCGRDVQSASWAAEMHHHRGAAQSLLAILHTVSLLLPSPLSIVHQMIACVSHFCAQLDMSANPDVIPFIVRVARHRGFGSPLPPAATLPGRPHPPLLPPPLLYSATPIWSTYPGQEIRVPPTSQQLSRHDSVAGQLYHHSPRSHQCPQSSPMAVLPSTSSHAPSSSQSHPSTTHGGMNRLISTSEGPHAR